MEEQIDLKAYRLNNFSELNELLKNKDFEIFFSDVWNFLDKMKENTFFNFHEYFGRSNGLESPLNRKKIEWFIKVVCAYISEISHLEYELSDDFTTVRRKLDDKLMQRFKSQCAERLRQQEIKSCPERYLKTRRAMGLIEQPSTVVDSTCN